METGVPLEQTSKGNWGLTGINWDRPEPGNIRRRLLILWVRRGATDPLRPDPTPAWFPLRFEPGEVDGNLWLTVWSRRRERRHYVTSSYITEEAATKIAAALCNWEAGGEEQHLDVLRDRRRGQNKI